MNVLDLAGTLSILKQKVPRKQFRLRHVEKLFLSLVKINVQRVSSEISYLAGVHVICIPKHFDAFSKNKPKKKKKP